MTRLSLPTLVIGPGLGARRSQILAQSVPLEDIAPADQQRLLELPLILAGWMRSGETDLYACIPASLDPEGARVLVRAHTIGELNGEPLGYAHAIYLPGEAIAALDGRAERLVELLPPPSESTAFAGQSLDIDLHDSPLLSGMAQASGLEWQDRAVLVERDEDRLPAVLALLAGLGHAPQHRRVIGWATSMEVPSRDSFSAAAALQLVAGLVPAPGWSGHLALRWQAGRISDAPLPAPDSWATRERLIALAAADPLLADCAPAMVWTFPMAAMSPPAVLGEMLARIMGRSPEGMATGLHLLDRVREHGLLGSDSASLATLLNHCPAQRGTLLSALLMRAETGMAAHRADAALVANPGWAGELDEPAFAHLLKGGSWLVQAQMDHKAAQGFDTGRLGTLTLACAQAIQTRASVLPPAAISRLRCTLEMGFTALLERADAPGLDNPAMLKIAQVSLAADPLPALRPLHVARLSHGIWRADPAMADVLVKKYINLRGKTDRLDDPDFAHLVSAAARIVSQSLERSEDAPA